MNSIESVALQEKVALSEKAEVKQSVTPAPVPIDILPRPVPVPRFCTVVGGCNCVDVFRPLPYDPALVDAAGKVSIAPYPISPFPCPRNRADCYQRNSVCTVQPNGRCGWTPSTQLTICLNTLNCYVTGCHGEICSNLNYSIPDYICPIYRPPILNHSRWLYCLRRYPQFAPRCIADVNGGCYWQRSPFNPFWCCLQQFTDLRPPVLEASLATDAVRAADAPEDPAAPDDLKPDGDN